MQLSAITGPALKDPGTLTAHLTLRGGVNTVVAEKPVWLILLMMGHSEGFCPKTDAAKEKRIRKPDKKQDFFMKPSFGHSLERHCLVFSTNKQYILILNILCCKFLTILNHFKK